MNSQPEIEWCAACGFRAREDGLSTCGVCARPAPPPPAPPAEPGLLQRVAERVSQVLSGSERAADSGPKLEAPCAACQVKERGRYSPYCDDCSEAQGW